MRMWWCVELQGWRVNECGDPDFRGCGWVVLDPPQPPPHADPAALIEFRGS
jgi:hypothetical protein